MLNDLEQVNIMLHEYDTLRNEILNRQNHLYQLFALAGLFFVWIAGHPIDLRFWISIAAAILVLGFGYWFIFRDTEKAAERLRQIEKKINDLAQDEILVWETRWGGAITGYWGRARPKLDPKSEA